MKKTKLFFFNAIILSLVNILMRSVSVSFNAYISVKVGEECMGLFTLVMSVYGLSVIFATSGVNLAVVRLVSEAYARIERYGSQNPKKELSKIVRGAVLYSLIFGVASGVFVFSFSDFIGTVLLGDIRTVMSLKVFAVSLPPIAVSSAISGYFTGIRRVYKNAIISVTEQLAKILIIMSGLVIFAPRGIEYACVAIVGGGAAAEGVSLVTSIVLYLFDRIKGVLGETKRKGEGAGFRRVSSLALPVAAGAYARQGLITAEHLAIPPSLGKYGLDKSESLAAYGVLHGMVMPLILFPSAVLYAFSSLLIPEISESRTLGEKDRICRIGEKVFRTSLLFSLCVSGVFLSFAGIIGVEMYQSVEAARQLRLMSVLIPVMYLDSAVDSMLKGLGEQVYCMKVNIADSAICLCLVFVLVPKMGIDGYILLTVISEVVNASFSIYKLLRVTGMRINLYKWLIAPFLSIIGATFVTNRVAAYFNIFISISVRICFCVILYLVFCVVFRAIKKEDLAFRKVPRV